MTKIDTDSTDTSTPAAHTGPPSIGEVSTTDGASPSDGYGAVLTDGELHELIAELITGLSARGETIATAESLTGGLIGAALTSVSGVSAVYRGGVISYATDLKGTLAGVSERTLADHGAVSPLTAVEMALGVAQRCDATWGVAVTGVAGPDRQEDHPPGTVFSAVARKPPGGEWDDQPSDSVVCVRQLELSGDRAQIRDQTVRRALQQLKQVCLA